MRQVGIERVTIGDKLARTIYSSDGQILLGKDVILTAGYISKLRNLGITAIYVKDDRLADVVVEDVVSEETRRDAMRSLKEASDIIRMGKKFDGFKIKKSVGNIVDEILLNRNLLLDLVEIRSQENYLFAHSLNVCIMATVLGVAYSLDRLRLVDLATGSLMHDFGKIELPQALVAKSESQLARNEVALLREHPGLGFEAIRKRAEHLSSMVAHVAYQHHENIDGSGYPRGLKGEEIHLYARMTAIANVYDKLVTGCAGRSSMLPHDACEYLMGLAGRYFDLELVRLFLKHVAVYPTGSSVKLSTGEVGVIVDQNPSMPMRPVVRVLQEHQRFVEPKEYDMFNDKTVFVTEVLR